MFKVCPVYYVYQIENIVYAKVSQFYSSDCFPDPAVSEELSRARMPQVY